MKPTSDKSKMACTVTVGAKGQFVIPKKMREMFSIQPGDHLLILADRSQGLALVPPDQVEAISERLFGKEK